MTTQTGFKTSSAKVFKTVLICILLIILSVALYYIGKHILEYFNHHLYFFGKIEQISNGNIFVLYTLIFLVSILYSFTPLFFEPIVIMTSVYYYKKFQFYDGLILSQLSLLIAVNISSVTTLLITRRFIRPYIIKEGNSDLYNTIMDVSNDLGILFVMLTRLLYHPLFIYNCLFGFSSISVTELIIGNFALIPRYLSISLFALVVADLDFDKYKPLNFKSHPSAEALFSIIYFFSALILVSVFYKSYFKVKGRVSVSSKENASSPPYNTMLNSEVCV
ncbi:multi-pass transmembrane [Cryptosporidium sp. chipmunk genotype I]|uniref:multi-pass transmembrane n=1 Tax=Cryptosporidium sp. chipmunk genotype I TaxID=1280935 RepID=UPI003519EC61|nr:multi-pass transmembrane [Cryptosporidium sp. chipmunk genotype I]